MMCECVFDRNTKSKPKGFKITKKAHDHARAKYKQQITQALYRIDNLGNCARSQEGGCLGFFCLWVVVCGVCM